MTKKRTAIVIGITVAIAIGLSLPLASAYSGTSSGLQGFVGIMMGRIGINTQQSSPYPSMMGNGYGGMMGGYYGSGTTPSNSSYWGGMMGGGMMGGYGTSYGMMGGYNVTGGMMTIQGQSISIQQATQSVSSPPSYAQITKSNDTISFHSQNINVVALAIMPDGAVNLTGTQPPSYSTGDVFVIYGLINPTLVIPKGATIQFTIVNLDNDMYHNLVVSSISPPYPYMAMQSMMSSFFSQAQTMMGFLPPANYSQGTAHEYTYSLNFAQAGNLWYLCTYPGHAQSGMYGKIIVGA